MRVHTCVRKKMFLLIVAFVVVSHVLEELILE